MKKKTLAEFEVTHGGEKIGRLQNQLATEHAKVEALADVQGKVVVETAKTCKIRFALFGDTQFGSLYTHVSAMRGFYDYCGENGIKTLYHTGDVLDGHKVYRGQEFELRDLGLNAQIDRMAKECPVGFTTKFITGNHDASFKTLAGVPVGKLINQARSDWVFLGEEQARVKWETPNGDFSLMLVHPGGGTSYALSYKVQKVAEALEGGTKPDMLAVGHFHKAEMIPSYRNICIVQTGAFQKQTPFMARNSLAAHVGGWLIDVTVGHNHNVIRGEFVAFYV